MKKYFIFLIVIFLNFEIIYSKEISLNDVRNITNIFISNKKNIFFKKQNNFKKFEIKSIESILNKFNKNIIFYLVNLKPKGFIIISNNKNIEPIIAYSFNYNINNLKKFKFSLLYKLLITDLNLRIKHYPSINRWEQSLKNYKINSFEKYEQWPDIDSTNTGGWIKTTWNQREPYNDFCPLDPVESKRCLSGCVATAIAQILNFYEYIGEVKLDKENKYSTNNGINIDSDSIRYDFPSFNQLNHYITKIKNNYANKTPLTIEEIKALNFIAGISVKMDYSYYSSQASIFNAKNAFIKYFNYDNALIYSANSTNFYDMLKKNIMNAHPAILKIVEIEEGLPKESHAIICDGYNTNDEYHLNFGWGSSQPDSITEAWYHLPKNIPNVYNAIESAIMDIYPIQKDIEITPSIIKVYSIINKKKLSKKLFIKNKSNNDLIIDSIIVNEPFRISYNNNIFNNILNDIKIKSNLMDSLEISIFASDTGYYSGTIKLCYRNQPKEYIPVKGYSFLNGTFISEKKPSGKWKVKNSPYYITRDVEMKDSKLTIAPGVKIVFLDKYSFVVRENAKLYAVGNEDNFITFLPYDTTIGWYGLTFFRSGIDDTLMYCDISYTKRNGKENQFLYNGGAIYCCENSNTYIRNNILHHNYTDNGGGGICIRRSSPFIINNIIANNKVRSSGGGIDINNYSDPLIVNNIIVNNKAECGASSSSGSAIMIFSFSNPYIACNTIVNNLGVVDGAIAVDDHFLNLFVNNIIWGNTPGHQILHINDVNNHNFNMIYCNIEENIDGEGNIMAFPDFISPSIGCGPEFDGLNSNWHLKQGSPCINSGISKTEMGAYGSIPSLLFFNNDSINFGIQPLFPGNYQKREIYLQNLSTCEPLIIDSIINKSQYFKIIDPSTFPMVINPGEKDTLQIQFNLDSTGIWIDSIKVYSNSVLGNHVLICRGEVSLLKGTLFNNENITKNLKNSDSPFYFLGNNYVPSNTIIEIDQGCKLFFGENSTLIIKGGLKVKGSYSNPVYFLPFDSLLGWNGIVFNAAKYKSEINYAIFKYGSGSYFYQTGKNGGAISCIRSLLTLKNSKILKNKTQRFGGGIYVLLGTLNLINCDISENEATCGGAIYFEGGYSSNIISSLISNNVANNSGGGIYFLGGTLNLINNTIVSNKAMRTGGGIEFGNKGNLINNIIYFNKSLLGYGNQIRNWDSLSISYCNIEKGIAGIYGETAKISYSNCISGDPLLTDTLKKNYRLTSLSPCIDSGSPESNSLGLPNTDLDGNERIWNNRIDIGAYEFGAPTILNYLKRLNFNFKLNTNYPNPFNPTTTISYIIPKAVQVELIIYNTLGQKIRTLVNQKLTPGQYSVVWDGKDDYGRNVASGIYLYQLKTKNFVQTKKMILIK